MKLTPHQQRHILIGVADYLERINELILEGESLRTMADSGLMREAVSARIVETRDLIRDVHNSLPAK